MMNRAIYRLHNRTNSYPSAKQMDSRPGGLSFSLANYIPVFML